MMVAIRKTIMKAVKGSLLPILGLPKKNISVRMRNNKISYNWRYPPIVLIMAISATSKNSKSIFNTHLHKKTILKLKTLIRILKKNGRTLGVVALWWILIISLQWLQFNNWVTNIAHLKEIWLLFLNSKNMTLKNQKCWNQNISHNRTINLKDRRNQEQMNLA